MLTMLSLSKKTLTFILLTCAAIMQSCAPLFSQNQNEPSPPSPVEPEPEPIVYQNPAVAMMKGYNDIAEIEIMPAWNLSEKQMITATQPPKQTGEGAKVRYIYPEDVQPTKEQQQEGSALTARQRSLMKNARLRARQVNAFKTRNAAETYNKEHSEILAKQEKEGLHIIIQLRKQRGVCKHGDKVLRSFRVCSGKRSTPTPQGHFHVMTKHEKHISNLYNSPMPYFMRLTMGGVGLHQGNMRGVPSSHGCVRLTRDDARYLFKKCDVGTPVFITN